MKATVLSLLSCIFVMLFTQRFRLYMFYLFPLSEPYNPPSWWTIIAQFHGSFRSTTLKKKGFILALRYITLFPAFPWQGWLNYTRKIDNKRTHLCKKTSIDWRSERKNWDRHGESRYIRTLFVAENVYACAETNITWSISSKVIGLESKSPRNVVNCGFVATVRDRKLFWSNFLSIRPRSALRLLDARRGYAKLKKVGVRVLRKLRPSKTKT